MKNTNYILAILLVVSLGLNAYQATNTGKGETSTANMSSNMSGMHMMPNGQMMRNDGTMMPMDSNMAMGDMTMNDMVGMMKGKTGKALEKEFLVGMVPHHQGAVDMAKIILADPTVSPQVKTFAQEIISAQEKEIKMMNDWLKNY